MAWMARDSSAPGRRRVLAHRRPSRFLLVLSWLGGGLTAYLCFCRVEQVPAVCEEALVHIEQTCGLDRDRALRFLRVRSQSTGHGLEESCRHLVDRRRSWTVRVSRLSGRPAAPVAVRSKRARVVAMAGYPESCAQFVDVP